MDKPALTMTKTFHKAPYPGISPYRPELSQKGKTVLIMGGSTGIGYATAKAFLQASAARVIISARRPAKLEAAVSDLRHQHEAAMVINSPEETAADIIGVPCDASDPSQVDQLWEGFRARGTFIDVLVLSNVSVPRAATLLDLGTEEIWNEFNGNVRAHLHMTERFYKQDKGEEIKRAKSLVNISTFAIHDWDVASTYIAYGLTKNSAALALQLIAQDVFPSGGGGEEGSMQIVSFNPGPVYTEGAKNSGAPEDGFEWNHVDLPAQFAVWAASPEARFLHGRFVWTEWDVDELKEGELRERIDQDKFFLKIGVRGL